MINSVALKNIKFDSDGLIPAIVQSVSTNRVLMLAWMNSESINESIERGKAVFFSRSRNELWEKGQTSGNIQHLISLKLDCDGDAILLTVDEAGPACHNGTDSCFDSATLYEK